MAEAISVIGAGGWGTTLALILAANGQRVMLREFVPAYARRMERCRENPLFLPGVRIPQAVVITPSLDEALAHARLLVLAVPSPFLRKTLRGFTAAYRGQPLLIGTKGLEVATGRTMSRVVTEELGRVRLAVLSGPTVARQIATGHPAAAVVAARSSGVAAAFQELLSCEVLRVYTNSDITGVELGGSLKNVYAIGAGMIDGLGLGTNTKASYITRAMKELTYAGTRLGGREKTFRGLAGIGDLITTCFSAESRNRRYGEALAGRKSSGPPAGMAVEGVPTARSLARVARERSLELPIAESICRILFRRGDPKNEIRLLMTRSLKRE